MGIPDCNRIYSHKISGVPQREVQNARSYNGEISCDQVCWLKENIRKAIISGINLKEQRLDSMVFDRVLEGLVEGTLLEMMNTCNMNVDKTNIFYK